MFLDLFRKSSRAAFVFQMFSLLGKLLFSLLELEFQWKNVSWLASWKFTGSFCVSNIFSSLQIFCLLDLVFEPSEENQLAWTEVHDKYKKLVSLCLFLFSQREILIYLKMIFFWKLIRDKSFSFKLSCNYVGAKHQNLLTWKLVLQTGNT